MTDPLRTAVESAIATRYAHCTLVGRAYDLGEPASRAELVERMVEDFRAVCAGLGLDGDAKVDGLQRRLYEECRTTGWDLHDENTFAEECAHLHEEVSEAFRAWRLYRDVETRTGPDGRPEGVPIELADILIGLFYNAERMGFDLLDAVERKHRFNLTRDYQAEGRQLHGPVRGQ